MRKRVRDLERKKRKKKKNKKSSNLNNREALGKNL